MSQISDSFRELGHSIANSLAKAIYWFSLLPWYIQLILAFVGILLVIELVLRIWDRLWLKK